MTSHQSHNDMSLRHRLMLENYEAAMERMPQDHRSVVWERASYGEFSELIGQEALWENFRSNPISSGMGGPYFWDDEYMNSIRSIWESPEFHKRVEGSFNNLCSLCGHDFVVGLVEPEVGRPVSCNVQGRKVAYLPDLTQIYNVHSLKPYIDAITVRKKPVVMAEIGGGYGGLANKLCKTFPDARYILFDLPEGTAIQYYYLSSFYEEGDFFLYKDFEKGGFEAFFSGNAKFAILPSFCSEDLPPSVVDVFINTDSMMEMNPSVIGQYFKSIHKATSIGGLFYCVNRRHKADVGVPVRIKDYPFDDRWYLSWSRPLPDSPNTQELVAIRTGHANAYPVSRALADLGPFTVSEVMGQWRQALRRTAAFVVGTGVGSGNPGLVNIILGLSEEPKNPIRKLRKRLAMIRSRLGKAWLRRGGGGKWDIS